MKVHDEGARTPGESPFGGEVDCASARDILPLRSLGALDPREARALEAHLAECPECAVEGDFVLRLQGARAEPPRRLLAEVMGAIPDPAVRMPAQERRRVAGLGWALAAAATVILALAIGEFGEAPTPAEPIWSLALDPEASPTWFGQDWMIAGAPQLDALSDEVLFSLLQEMSR